MNGLVVSYNDRKGYGFIAPLIGKPDSTPEVFFHVSAIRREQGLRPCIPNGAEVRFELVRGAKGPQAANVELVRVRHLPARAEQALPSIHSAEPS